MNSNKGLTMARKGRKDEFYTRYQDVCSELSLCAGWLGGGVKNVAERLASPERNGYICGRTD